MHSSQTVILQIEAGVASVTLNRPDVLNAIDDEMRLALRDTLQSVSTDDSVRVVIVTGSGRFFSAGADLKSARPTAENTTQMLAEEYGPALCSIAEMPKPVIAALNGPAVGIGLAYALASDLIVMGAGAYLQAPFIKLNLLPDGGLSWLLPRALGYQRAFEFVAEAQTISADRALELGVVNRVVPDDKVVSEAREWADSLCERAPLGLAAAKQALRRNASGDYRGSLELEARLQGALVETDDCQEGFDAFVEKREPRFRGS